MQRVKIKLPYIKILFILYFAERDQNITASKVVKVCRVNKVNYVDELCKIGLVKLYYRVKVRKRITVYVAISKSGLEFMTKVFDLVTKHGLWDYIQVSLHNGLLLLDNESTRLIHALSLLVLRDENSNHSHKVNLN